MVVQTRSKAVESALDDSQERSEVVEEPIGARLEEMFKRTQALEISVAEQNKNMAEVLILSECYQNIMLLLVARKLLTTLFR